MTKSKSKIIEEIIKATGVNGEEYFDKLSDHTQVYLEKLLKVINAL